MKRLIATTVLILLSTGALGAEWGRPEPRSRGGRSRDEKLLEIPVPGAPTIALSVLLETGSADDPADKPGLCSLTMRAAVEGGTPTLTKGEVAERLYPMATSAEVFVDRETTIFTGRVRREDIDAFYPIFWDLIFHPRFDTEDIERTRRVSLSSLRNDLKGSSTEWLGKEALQASLFQGTPWEHPPLGTESGLQAIEQDDVRAFHRQGLVRGLVHVGIAGGYDTAFAERIRRDIAAIPGLQRPPGRAPLRPSEAHGLDLLLIDAPVPATAISIGFTHNVRRGHPDYWPLVLATTAFGEHRTFLGRLQREMRSTRGLNYGDYAYLEHFDQDGWVRFARPNLWRTIPYFSIWIRPVQPANGLFALRQGLWELRHLIDEGLSREEFETTRKHLRNVSQLWGQTLARRLGMALDDAHSGMGDSVEELEKALDAMSLEEVNGALRRNLTGRDVKAALVCANADSLRRLLLSGARTTIVYSGGAAPAEVKAKDAQIEAMPLGIERIEVIPVGMIFR